MLVLVVLKKIYLLGKLLVLEDNGYVLVEFGVIFEYLQEIWDSGGLLKLQGIDDKLQYCFWLYYVEGLLMLLLLMKLVFVSFGKFFVFFGVCLLGLLLGKGIQKMWFDLQLVIYVWFIDDYFVVWLWFVGEWLSMVDIQMSFLVMVLLVCGGMYDFVYIEVWCQ